MKKSWPLFGVVMVFLLGILCGSLATHLLYCYRYGPIMGVRGEAREEMLVNRLEGKLKLDKRQVDQVRVIVHDTREGITALRGQIRPQMEALIGSAQTRINLILTPEQREKFGRMIAERKEKMREKGF
jgi:hypothetical protein